MGKVREECLAINYLLSKSLILATFCAGKLPGL